MKPLIACLLLISSFGFLPSSFGAESPQLIPFQGTLVNSAGAAYPNGQFAITFAIYNEAVGGTPVWTERHEKVGVINGMVNVFLGSINSFLKTNWSDNVNFGTTKYLGITVDADGNPATADKEMAPRQLLLTAFYSPTTDKLQDYGWDVLFGNQNPSASTILSTKIPAVTLDKLPQIPGTKLEANLTSNALAGANQSIVPSGGIVMSENANNTALLNAGYAKLGSGQMGEGWRQLRGATTPASGGGTNPYAVSSPAYCWTGSPRNEFIVWGGEISNTDSTNLGSRFDVITNTWSPVTTANAPTKRLGCFFAWTGTELVVWGGRSNSDNNAIYYSDGKTYNPATDTWTNLPAVPPEISLQGRLPSSVQESVWIEANGVSALFIWGGYGNGGTILGDGALLSKSGGTWSWTAIPMTNAPSPRYGHCMAWTGSRVIVWGGHSGGSVLGDGRLYDPVSNTWSTTAMSSSNSPAPRSQAACRWSGAELLIWGGTVGSSSNTASGAAFNPSTNQWREIPTPTNVIAPRNRANSAWTGSEFMIWSGTDQSTRYDDGARYSPATNSWVKIPPSGRVGSDSGTTIWTGSEMLVFGGTLYATETWRNDLWSYTPPRTLYFYQKQ